MNPHSPKPTVPYSSHKKSRFHFLNFGYVVHRQSPSMYGYSHHNVAGWNGKQNLPGNRCNNRLYKSSSCFQSFCPYYYFSAFSLVMVATISVVRQKLSYLLNHTESYRLTLKFIVLLNSSLRTNNKNERLLVIIFIQYPHRRTYNTWW